MNALRVVSGQLNQSALFMIHNFRPSMAKKRCGAARVFDILITKVCYCMTATVLWHCLCWAFGSIVTGRSLAYRNRIAYLLSDLFKYIILNRPCFTLAPLLYSLPKFSYFNKARYDDSSKIPEAKTEVPTNSETRNFTRESLSSQNPSEKDWIKD